MAKPICVIKVNMDVDFGGGVRADLYKIREYMLKELIDYHVFVLPNREYDSDAFEFITYGRTIGDYINTLSDCGLVVSRFHQLKINHDTIRDEEEKLETLFPRIMVFKAMKSI